MTPDQLFILEKQIREYLDRMNDVYKHVRLTQLQKDRIEIYRLALERLQEKKRES